MANDEPSPKPGSKLEIKLILGRVAAGYRHDWKLLLAVGLVVYGPIGLLAALGPLEDFRSDEWSGGWSAALVALVVIQATVPLLGAVFYSGVVAAGEEARESGTRHGFAHIARTLPYWSLILADLALFVALVLGFLLLIVPALVFFAWFSLIAPVIEMERLGVRAAFSRSRELVRPHFWRVAGVMVPLSVLQSMLEGVGDGIGHGLLGDTFFGNWAASVVANLLGSPLYALTVLALYFEILAREQPANE